MTSEAISTDCVELQRAHGAWWITWLISRLCYQLIQLNFYKQETGFVLRALSCEGRGRVKYQIHCFSKFSFWVRYRINCKLLIPVCDALKRDGILIRRWMFIFRYLSGINATATRRAWDTCEDEDGFQLFMWTFIKWCGKWCSKVQNEVMCK